MGFHFFILEIRSIEKTAYVKMDKKCSLMLQNYICNKLTRANKNILNIIRHKPLIIKIL